MGVPIKPLISTPTVRAACISAGEKYLVWGLLGCVFFSQMRSFLTE